MDFHCAGTPASRARTGRRRRPAARGECVKRAWSLGAGPGPAEGGVPPRTGQERGKHPQGGSGWGEGSRARLTTWVPGGHCHCEGQWNPGWRRGWEEADGQGPIPWHQGPALHTVTAPELPDSLVPQVQAGVASTAASLALWRLRFCPGTWVATWLPGQYSAGCRAHTLPAAVLMPVRGHSCLRALATLATQPSRPPASSADAAPPGHSVWRLALSHRLDTGGVQLRVQLCPHDPAPY